MVNKYNPQLTWLSADEGGDGDPDIEMVKDEDGCWVEFDDYNSLVEALWECRCELNTILKGGSPPHTTKLTIDRADKALRRARDVEHNKD